jgi:hypothetical protein
MPTAEEFQEYARESLEAAASAKTEAAKLTFLQMAQTWSRAATAAGQMHPRPEEGATNAHANRD